MGEHDQLRQLEQQVERGSLFAHTALSEQAIRTNENEAMINGLVDFLVGQGLVELDGLRGAVESARKETVEKGEFATLGVAIRVDGADATEPPAVVDCDARLPVCKAVCCRLRFALSAEEIESGPMRWDLGQPYLNRVGERGYCHQIDPASGHCGVYEDRPTVCRQYSCAGDARIWKDFDAMQLNQEWIDAHLETPEVSFVQILMDG
jgi:Fe-S-cluster containining protein